MFVNEIIIVGILNRSEIKKINTNKELNVKIYLIF